MERLPMLIVTAGSNNYLYEKTIKYCQARCEQYGYACDVYDVGNLGFGIQWDDPRCSSHFRRVKSAMKPELILTSLEATQEKTVVWIDGDATLIKPIPEIDEDDSFDIGLTVRGKVSRKKTCYINAGVIFVKNTSAGKAFVRSWVDAMPPVPELGTIHKPPDYSDQVTLEEKILLPALNTPLWDLVGEVHMVLGARVKFFDCETYNNFSLIKAPRWEEGPGTTKILHFKGHRMHRIDGYHEKFLRD